MCARTYRCNHTHDRRYPCVVLLYRSFCRLEFDIVQIARTHIHNRVHAYYEIIFLLRGTFVKRKVAYRSGYLVNRWWNQCKIYGDVIYDADLLRDIYVPKKIYIYICYDV